MLNRIFDDRTTSIERIKPWEIFGGKRPFFLKYADVIKDVIQDFHLQPINQEIISPTVQASNFEKSTLTKERIAYIDPGIHGGKRFAHLHYRGDIYMLNHEQWRAFTGRIKNDMMKRLEMAESISVEQFQDLSDAIDPIA